MTDGNKLMKVRRDDLWLMLLSMVRYSMGRSSYIVGTTRTALARHGRDLEPHQRAQVVREIREALAERERDGKPLGMEMDHTEWKVCADEVEQMDRTDGE